MAKIFFQLIMGLPAKLFRAHFKCVLLVVVSLSLSFAGADAGDISSSRQSLTSLSAEAHPSGDYESSFSLRDNPDSSPAQEQRTWRDNFRLSGFADIYGGADLNREEKNEHTRSYRQRLRAEARYTFRTEAPSFPGFLGTPDPYIVVSVESDYLWFGTRNNYDDHDLDLYEAYLNWDRGPWQLRLGKQLVRWGKTDQLSPVDNVNAEDMRQFLILDLEDRKIPDWMARVTYFQRQWSLEGIFIPFHQAHEIDYFGTDWAVYRHARQDILDSDLPDAFREYARGLSVNENKPSKTLENSSFGTRLSTTVNEVDMAVSWLYTRESIPFFKSFPVENIDVDGPLSLGDLRGRLADLVLVENEDIEVEYARTRIYGFEFETVLRNFGLRGEAAYFDQQTFIQSDLTSVSRPVLHAVAGVDYIGLRDWYANIQLSSQHIYNYRDEILFFKDHNFSIIGELSREWVRGTWETGVRGIYFLSDRSSHLHPYVTYTPVTNLDITLGLHLFDGKRDTVLGQYRENDQAYLRLKYHF